jgi:hypothetical protein
MERVALVRRAAAPARRRAARVKQRNQPVK